MTPFLYKRTKANVPNTLSTLGLVSAVAWLMGAGPGYAIVSIVLDELDGTFARIFGQTSKFGGEYDSAIDMCLQGAVAVKIGAPWLLVFTVPLSVAEKIAEKKKGGFEFGSYRGAMMSYALLKGIR